MRGKRGKKGEIEGRGVMGESVGGVKAKRQQQERMEREVGEHREQQGVKRQK